MAVFLSWTSCGRPARCQLRLRAFPRCPPPQVPRRLLWVWRWAVAAFYWNEAAVFNFFVRQSLTNVNTNNCHNKMGQILWE